VEDWFCFDVFKPEQKIANAYTVSELLEGEADTLRRGRELGNAVSEGVDGSGFDLTTLDGASELLGAGANDLEGVQEGAEVDELDAFLRREGSGGLTALEGGDEALAGGSILEGSAELLLGRLDNTSGARDGRLAELGVLVDLDGGLELGGNVSDRVRARLGGELGDGVTEGRDVDEAGLASSRSGNRGSRSSGLGGSLVVGLVLLGEVSCVQKRQR